MSAGYFVLFHSEGMVKAVTIHSTPKGFTFGGSTYQYCKHTDFNHLVRGSVLVGFQFLSPEDMGDEFLSSQFVRDSRNVVLDYWGGKTAVIEIYLGSREEPETDQAAVFGGLVFASGQQDYILALPRVPWADLEFGFELATGDIPSPITNSVTEN